jgi:hypothetical protein
MRRASSWRVLWHQPVHDPHHHVQPEGAIHDVYDKIYNVMCGTGVLVESARE